MIDGPQDRLPEDLEEARRLEDRPGEDVDVVVEADEHRLPATLGQQAGRDARIAEPAEAHVRERDVELPQERVDDEGQEPHGRRRDEQDRQGEAGLQPAHEDEVQDALQDRHPDREDGEGGEDLG